MASATITLTATLRFRDPERLARIRERLHLLADGIEGQPWNVEMAEALRGLREDLAASVEIEIPGGTL